MNVKVGDTVYDTATGKESRYEIPEWCCMPLDEHLCAGGCWGILVGNVAREGLDYCCRCECWRGVLQHEVFP
jgi:hypothetical protein